MNWMLILVVLIVAGNMIWGFYRGFLRVVLSMAGWVVIVALVAWATPYMSQALAEHTAIDDRIEESFHDKIRELVRDGELSGEDGSGPDLGIPLPQVILDKLLDTNDMADRLLEDTGIYDEMAGKAAGLAVRGISFVVILLIAIIGFHLLSLALNLVSKLPVIEGVNRFFGGLAGFVKGFLLVWLAFAFIAMSSATAAGMVLTGYIYESPLLVWLYENNLILTILMIFL